MSTNEIHKEIQLKASRSKVWKAISDASEFGAWFGVNLDGAFVVGEKITGRMKNPKFAHIPFELWVERMEPEHSFAYRWHPYALDPERDYSDEPTTLVEFHLEESEGGTLLKVTESGFDALPKDRAAEAFRMNEGGWAHQIGNIQNHVDG